MTLCDQQTANLLHLQQPTKPFVTVPTQRAQSSLCTPCFGNYTIFHVPYLLPAITAFTDAVLHLLKYCGWTNQIGCCLSNRLLHYIYMLSREQHMLQSQMTLLSCICAKQNVNKTNRQTAWCGAGGSHQAIQGTGLPSR